MIEEQLSEPNTNQESNYDQNVLQTIKQQVCLNNHQLLQLTYNDQKFYQKLKQFNHFGCIYIHKTQFMEALIYLNEAEKILEYAASCGKTIQRNLIITTLNNQASLYQKAWEIEKAQSYIEAIIYNISTFFQNKSQNLNNHKLEFNQNILDENSSQYQDFSISLWRKKSLALYYLQFCAVNSQNKNHQNAFSSASKAVNLLKQICMEFYEYEAYIKEFQNKNNGNKKEQLADPNNYLLFELASIKAANIQQIQFQDFYKLAVKYIACYIKRLQSQQNEDEQFMESYKLFFQNYSIGNLMQINPIQLQEQSDKLNLKQQISLIQKHYKAIYLSVGHFILATEARFISTQKYTLDQNQRKSSSQFKESQIYHLYSIIIATKYLLCQSGYFDHVVNSFRNHYKLDILQDAKKYYELNSNTIHEQILLNNSIFQRPHFNLNQKQKEKRNQLQEILKQSSQINPTAKYIPNNNNQKDSGSESKRQDSPISPKNHAENQMMQVKQFKTKQNTGVKKSQHKKSITPLTKSQARLQAHETNKMTSSQHENKNLLKNLNLMTSRQKQNKQKQNKIKNTNKSRSKKKSEYQFFQSNKKINIVNGALNKKQDKKDTLKQQTVYTKRQSDYLPKQKSRSKSKRIPTSIQTQRKLIRRKDSCADLRKTKKVEDQYGIHGKHVGIQNVNEGKTSRNNNNNLKKSKNRRQSDDKLIKLTSPQIKMKKLKSPRNIKK